HRVGRQSIASGEGFELTVGVASDAAVFRGHPKRPIRALDNLEEAVAFYARGVASIEDAKAHAVISHDPVQRREPEIAVARLDNRMDRVLGKTRISRPPVEAVLAASRHRKENEH